MPKEIKGIIVSRLIVFITIIILPITIFIIFNLVDFKLWFSTDPNLTIFIVKFLCPLVFSISWLFFLILFANRVSQTLDSMDKTVRVIPLRLKFFFGINAIFILFIFIFPLITPLISALSFASMAWRLTTFRKELREDDKISFSTRLLMILFSLLPIFCAICIIPEYLLLTIFLWRDVWIPLLDYIFIISLCLCTALAIGSLFVLILNSGISEIEEIFINPDERPSLFAIYILEILLFIFFLILAIGKFPLIDLFYNIGFFIVIFVFIVNFFSGKKEDSNFRGHFLGYILAAVFMGSNLLIFNLDLAKFLQVWSLVISATLFIFVFFYTFLTMEETEF